MNPRYLTLACVLVAAVSLMLLWRHGSHSAERAAKQPEPTVSVPTPATTSRPALLPEHQTATGTDGGPHAHAVELAKQWMSAAKPFNCDPVVTRVLERTNPATGLVVEYEVVTSNYS